MPVSSEKPYDPEPKEGPGSAVSTLTQWFSSLTVQDTSVTDKWKITQFETTPPVRILLYRVKSTFLFNNKYIYTQMSSYLVAFANGHFEYLESSYTSPLSGKIRPLRIYSQFMLPLKPAAEFLTGFCLL